MLDTNIWKSHRLLRTPLGAALIYFLHTLKARLGLPEVVEMEIRKHIPQDAAAAVQDVEESLATLQMLVGWRPAVELPTPEEIASAVDRRMADLRDLLERVPFTEAHARAAIKRVNAEEQPNGPGNQQFKDSAVWEALLNLRASFRVLFVTADKQFFQGRDPKTKQLAANLRQEGRELDRDVTIFSGLEELLRELGSTAPRLDQERAPFVIDDEIREEVQQDATRYGFEILEVVGTSIVGFVTEQELLAIQFGITYGLVDAEERSEVPRNNATLSVQGECYFDPGRLSVSQVQIEEVSLGWDDPDTGQRVQKSIKNLRTGFSPPKRIPLAVRKPLSELQ